jgi:methyl-accepting chemotaxis protein
MSATKAYNRKLLNFSVNRAMQFRMIGKIGLILFVSQLLCGLIFLYFSNQEITASFQMFHIKARNFLDFLWPVVISAVVISLVFGFIGSLFFPKPIAGGLYRIEEDLKQIIDSGDFTEKIKLREGDQVTAVAKQINLLLEDLQERIGQSQQELQKLEELNNSSATPEKSEIERIRLQLHELIGGLKV